MQVMPWQAGNGPTFKVTPSHAHDWNVCGGFFAARHMSGQKEPKTYPQLFGTAVHELVKAYENALSSTTPSIPAIVTRHWKPGVFSIEENEKALHDATEMLGRFAELRAAEDIQVIESECFERTKPRPLSGGRYIFLSGKIDRLSRRPDGVTEVMDFKTGADLPSAGELADDPATTIYCLLAERRCPHTRIVVVQMSLHSGARSEIELTAPEIDAGKARIREMVRQVAENDFSHTPSGACAYCPASNGCAALDSDEGDEELESAW